LLNLRRTIYQRMTKFAPLFFGSILCLISYGQNLELSGSYGYTFGDRAQIYGGEARISDGALYNFAVNFFLDEDYSLEASYNYQKLEGRAFSSFWNFDVRDKIRLNYLLLGANRYFEINHKMSAFGGLKGGILNLSSVSNSFRTRTKLAVGIKGGLCYEIVRNFGLKAQLQLLFPITDVGASLWWSPGQGTAVGVSSNTPFVQFGSTIGLFYRLPF